MSYFRIKSFLNNLCLGLDGDNNVVMKESDDDDNSQVVTRIYVFTIY